MEENIYKLMMGKGFPPQIYRQRNKKKALGKKDKKDRYLFTEGRHTANKHMKICSTW